MRESAVDGHRRSRIVANNFEEIVPSDFYRLLYNDMLGEKGLPIMTIKPTIIIFEKSALDHFWKRKLN